MILIKNIVNESGSTGVDNTVAGRFSNILGGSNNYIAEGADSVLLINCTNVTVQGGSVILPLAFVNTDSFIGENSIVGAGVLIDHDVKISSHSHLRMGTKVNSKVILPEEFESKTGEVML